jgi:hypothetical protein
MRTDAEFWREHKGHEAYVEGDQFSQTCHITYGSYGGQGTATCPKCNVEETVLMTGKICEKHRYGQHIRILCKDCKEEGTTKNIDYIGARTIFLTHKDDCPQQSGYEHLEGS